MSNDNKKNRAKNKNHQGNPIIKANRGSNCLFGWQFVPRRSPIIENTPGISGTYQVRVVRASRTGYCVSSLRPCKGDPD